MRTLNRYILRELIEPFIFGVAAFTSIFIAGDLLFSIARLLADGTISVNCAIQLFVLGIPRIVVITFPMSVLLGTLLCFGRLSDSSEIVAMRAAGVSTRSIIAPAILLAVVMSLFTVFLNETIVPASNQASQDILWSVTNRGKPLTEKDIVIKTFRDGRLDRLVYAEEFDADKKELTNVTVQDFRNGKLVRVTNAPKAIWDRNRWWFMNGAMYDIVDGNRMVSVTFKTHESLIAQAPEEIARRQKTPQEMGISELRAYIRMLREQGQNVSALLVELYLKLAIPFASLVFALVGAPLGIRTRRSSSSLGFGTSIILIFIYYVIMSMGTAFGQRGSVPPFIGAWSQNFIFGGIGLWMVLRSD
ncbi:MAG TPA: LPS export ABC transporter permease LptG [Firmicutes bacterium]|nr:LPS export ABC transporter permease LptG [Bacillota bacterium]